MNVNLSPPGQGAPLLTVKRLLFPLIAHPRVAHTLKYVVYLGLIFNLGRFVWDDYLAMQAALPEDASLSDYLTQFSTSIDMVAWVGLVFLFELETYAVPDYKWTTWLAGIIRTLRVVCYLMIGYAAYGYTVESLENYETTEVAGLTNVCELADQGTSLQTSIFEYVEITSGNCESLSNDNRFYRISNEVSVIDESTLDHVQWLGWLDIDNAYIWLIVVFLIEAEVWLQSRDRFSSPTLNKVRVTKSFFYLVLIGNMVIWLVNGYYLYAWDAFLWIFGFWAIEMNLAEWEMDRVDELRAQPIANM